MRSNPVQAIAVAVAISVGCAPQVDGPVEHQRAIDREDSERLAGQLAQLPGVVSASVVLHHPTRDPLAAALPRPATFTAVINVDDKADRDAIRAATTRLAQATLPELSAGTAAGAASAGSASTAGGARPTGSAGGAAEALLRGIEIHATVHRPTVARLGPFSVEDGSRASLKATLAIGCAAIAALAAALAVLVRRHRLGNSAQ